MAKKKPADPGPPKPATVDMFEEAVQQNREDAKALRKTRDADLYEALETETQSALRWVAEVSKDRKIGYVFATEDGKLVISRLVSVKADRVPCSVKSIILNPAEANQLREFLNAG